MKLRACIKAHLQRGDFVILMLLMASSPRSCLVSEKEISNKREAFKCHLTGGENTNDN